MPQGHRQSAVGGGQSIERVESSQVKSSRGKAKRWSNPETLSPAGVSGVRTEHKLFSCLDTNTRKKLWRIKASVTSGRIKKSGSFFSGNDVHPVVVRFRASRRMNILTTEIECSSRYDFLILKIDWNVTKNLFSYCRHISGSRHVRICRWLHDVYRPHPPAIVART